MTHAAAVSLRVAPCEEADVPALMRFIDEHWRAGHVLGRDEALLRWQFARELVREWRGGPTVMLAWLDDRIVGMLGLTGFEFNAAGTRFPALWLSHWFAAPDCRRFNVALQLMWTVLSFGVDALATLSARDASAKLLARMGFEVISGLPRWVGVFDADRAAALVSVANPGISAEDAGRLCQSHLVALPTAEAVDGEFATVSWSPAVSAAWDRFWNEQLAARLVGANRDAAYLRWRYIAHPRFEYEVRFAQRHSHGAVEGIVVFRLEQVRDRPTRVLRIVEFLATAPAAAFLARCVLEAARSSGVAMGDFYCTSPLVAQPLARTGFRRQTADSGGPVFPSRFQPLEPGHFPMTTLIRFPAAWRGTLPQLVEDGRLYITKADGDQDRPN